MDAAADRPTAPRLEPSKAISNPLDFVPTPGMILWSCVPDARKPARFPPPGPKSRPAFVKSVYPGEKQGDPPVVVIVPGTSKPSSTGTAYSWDFSFDDDHKNFSESGLAESTRFAANLIVSIPFTSEYFGECAPGASDHNAQKPNAIMGSAHAIRDVIEKAFAEWSKEIKRRRAQFKS